MNALLASARAVHFAATMWLFGELVFVCALSVRRGRDAPTGPGAALHRRLSHVARCGIAIGIASAFAWLAAAAATMSGVPLPQAIEPETLGTVLVGTLFGKVWISRLGLALVLLIALWPRSTGRGGWRLALSTIVAGVYLAALAWTGHAAAAEGPWRGAQLVSDVVHLISAGAWLGALPPLVYLLGTTRPIEHATWATHRFSTVAIACVSALILSGVGNSWFLVGSVPALFGTTYGALLLAKLALLALMLSLAALNRLGLTPRLGAGDRHAVRVLRRNALLEIVAGLFVVAIVGVLGITIPAAHQSVLWPFAHTLSWAPAQESATRWPLVAAALVAAAGATTLVIGARRRAWRSATAGLIGVAASAMASAWLLAVPSYPTTYASSPVRYTTAAIVDGERLFATHCVACHGSDGTRGARAAAELSTRPANLVEHAGRHRPGELYWWIAHGRAGTPMPGFSPPLGSDEIWSIVQFLQSLSDAASAAGPGGELVAEPTAPDFNFELAGRGQQTLLTRDEARDTLLVLYSLPDSLSRLRSLASQRRGLDDERIRVLAVAWSGADAEAAGAQTPGGESMLAIAAPDVAKAYAEFAAPDRAVGANLRHTEFLIRDGRLRARWIGVPAADVERNQDIWKMAEKVDREPPRAPPSHQHAH